MPHVILFLPVLVGAVFGFLLHRAKVSDCNLIADQFRLRDFTVLKVFTSAVIVGGFGVLLLVQFGLAKYHIIASAR